MRRWIPKKEKLWRDDPAYGHVAAGELKKASEWFGRMTEEALQEHRLDQRMHAILEVLAHEQPLQMSTIAARLGCDEAQITRIAPNLRQRGYVGIQKRKDRRRKMVTLTAQGEEILRQIDKSIAIRVSYKLSSGSSERRGRLSAALRDLNSWPEDPDEVPGELSLDFKTPASKM